MTILERKEFNERFTCLNAEGKPVERLLREMTAAEVLDALWWQDAHATKLHQQSEHGKAGLAAAMLLARVEAGGTLDEAELALLGRYCDERKRASAETEKFLRLTKLVLSTIPSRYNDMPIREGLRRSWPGGRAA